MPAKVVTGARAKVAIKGKVVGIFNNVSYSLGFQADPIYILGRYSPAETVFTAQDAVSITASGWRVVHQGPHISASVPTLSELLMHEYLEITILDRADESKPIAKFTNCRPVSYSTSLANRQPSEVSITFIGLTIDSDEDRENTELPSAATL